MKTSIVILTYNKLDYTKQCIESIRQYTKSGTYEMIVVDNHSDDDTISWLSEQQDIVKILNTENVGFPKGCNQGIMASSGDSVLLLNNDTIVTHHWLENLESCLYSSENIGAVGPVTNSCSNLQTVQVSYTGTEQMQEFAKGFNVQNPLLWEERIRLIGFCLLIKRAVMNKIGLLDELFSPGNFEDDDYCLRMRKKGYRLILCRDTFIHHYGSVSFSADRDKYFLLLNFNKKKFEAKWGVSSIYEANLNTCSLDELLKNVDHGMNVEENIAEVVRRLQANDHVAGMIHKIMNEDISNKMSILNMLTSKCCEKSLCEIEMGLFETDLMKY